MKPRWSMLLVFTCVAFADPPGASVKVAVTVPAAYATGIFAQPQSLTVPPGFQISVWARLDGARFLAIAPNGDVFVSQPGGGSVYLYRPVSGALPKQYKFVSGLNSPHGIAFDTVDGVSYIYIAESNQIDRFVYNAGDTASHDRKVIVTGLPDGSLPEFASGYSHPLKNIAVGPDHLIYVGLGSSCNVCASDAAANPVRGSVYVYNPDGSGGRIFARGLRNAEGLAFVPGTNTLWAAVNNRDQLPYPYQDSTNQYDRVITSYVDDHPPEPFTNLRDGGNYGWPFCNPTQDGPTGFDNMKFDLDLDTNLEGKVSCSAMDTIKRGFQAHSAPAAIHLCPELKVSRNLPEWSNGRLSWFMGSNSSYRVQGGLSPWNTATGRPGTQVDLVSGLQEIGSRPAGLAITPSGTLLITDDASGTIFELTYSAAVVSGADGYPVIAPDSYATLYASGMSQQTLTAVPPYPMTLGGVSLPITDSAGNSFQASLSFVSPTQINFVAPSGMAPGTAMIGAKTGNSGAWPVMIQSTAPALFSLNGTGTGTAAATALDSSGNSVPVFGSAPPFSEVPIGVTGPAKYLSLYGTGIRGVAAGSLQVLINGVPVPVTFAGSQSSYPGLDQVNVQLPASLAGTGEAQIQIAAGSWISNTVTIKIL